MAPGLWVPDGAGGWFLLFCFSNTPPLHTIFHPPPALEVGRGMGRQLLPPWHSPQTMELQKQALGWGMGVNMVGITEKDGEGDQGLRGGVKVVRAAQIT